MTYPDLYVLRHGQTEWNLAGKFQGRKNSPLTELGKSHARQQRAILERLVESEGFEKFLDVKFKGTKRFGLDGGETVVPAIEQIIKRGGQLGVKSIVLGMAHRGQE